MVRRAEEKRLKICSKYFPFEIKSIDFEWFFSKRQLWEITLVSFSLANCVNVFYILNHFHGKSTYLLWTKITTIYYLWIMFSVGNCFILFNQLLLIEIPLENSNVFFLGLSLVEWVNLIRESFVYHFSRGWKETRVSNALYAIKILKKESYFFEK